MAALRTWQVCYPGAQISRRLAGSRSTCVVSPVLVKLSRSRSALPAATTPGGAQRRPPRSTPTTPFWESTKDRDPASRPFDCSVIAPAAQGWMRST